MLTTALQQSESTIDDTLTTSGYVIDFVAVCLEVLITRTELEQVSEIAEAEKPMTALRISRLGRSSY